MGRGFSAKESFCYDTGINYNSIYIGVSEDIGRVLDKLNRYR